MSRTIKDVIDMATSQAVAEHYPTPVERLVKGRPMQHNTVHFQADNRFFVGEWGAEPGCWKVRYTENEFFHILAGKSILRDLEGREMELAVGAMVCIPAGFEGEWEVLETTRKIYAIYEAPDA